MFNLIDFLRMYVDEIQIRIQIQIQTILGKGFEI